MENIYNKTRKYLEENFIKINEKSYKATQVFSWIYEKNARSFEEMSNIKRELQTNLASVFNFDFIKIKKIQKSEETRKYFYLNSKTGI